MKTIIKATWGGRKSTSKKLRRLDRKIKRISKIDRLFNLKDDNDIIYRQYKVDPFNITATQIT